MSYLICIGGLPGAGKTTLALRLLEEFSDAVMIDPDITRLKILGKNPEINFLTNQDITPETTAQTIEVMGVQVSRGLKEGKVVIVGSAFLSESMREQYERLANDGGARFISVWLEVSRDVRLERAQKRQMGSGNPSAINGDLVSEATVEGEVLWPVIAANKSQERVFKQVMALINII